MSFEFHGEQGLGALENLGVVDLGRAHKLFQAESVGILGNKPAQFPRRMIDFLEIGEDIARYTSILMDRVHALLPRNHNDMQEQGVLLDIADLRILPPVPVPRKIVCLGVNYRDHAEEAHVPIPERPIIFSKPSTAVVGTEGQVIYPNASTQVDYEVELAAVIGRIGRNVPESDAFSHVAGYTVLNDVSARDIQFADRQWFRGKGFDTFAPTGPCLVLREQLGDPHNLKMELRVNGEVRQRSTTANMIFKIPQLVASISNVMTLQPGDIIGTGTPAGVGFYARPEKRLLKPGDIMEAEIEGIGVLRNKVVSAD